MQLEFSSTQSKFRQEIRSFLKEVLGPEWSGILPDSYFTEENFPKVRFLTKKLAQKGWLTMSWPKQYGGLGMNHFDHLIFSEEMAYYRAPTRDMTIGTELVGPTLMVYGEESQKERFLPSIANGNSIFCQGFSEPGSGSDLASLKTSAVKDGDEYIINGSKIWTSGAHKSTHCYLMTRTNTDAPKHKGISIFIVDMKTAGISVKPIKNMFGVHYFNEIFFDGVRVPVQNMIGKENEGWYIAAKSLDFERSGASRFATNKRNLEDILFLAKNTILNGISLSSEAKFRRRFSKLWTSNEAGKLLAHKVCWMQSKGLIPNREAAASKLIGSEIAQKISRFGVKSANLHGLLTPDDAWAPLNGRLAIDWMDTISFTIRSGTSEIQKNIIATRGLGLPRS
ncbi:MAG: acyl-CoA dehydrogenase family protein [Dehalococcoidia bacterium]